MQAIHIRLVLENQQAAGWANDRRLQLCQWLFYCRSSAGTAPLPLCCGCCFPRAWQECCCWCVCCWCVCVSRLPLPSKAHDCIGGQAENSNCWVVQRPILMWLRALRGGVRASSAL